MPDLRDSRFYHDMAEENRTKAGYVRDAMLRQSYLDLAASYDHLADALERIERQEAEKLFQSK